MPRRKLIRSDVLPYHVYGKSNYDEWFPCSMGQVWACFAAELGNTSIAYGLRIHAFVLMSNHYHLVVSTPDSNLDHCMHYLLREVARRLNYRSAQRGHRFNGPYQSKLVRDPLYYRQLIRYVYLNPSESGLAQSPAAYPYSTLGRMQGDWGRIEFPVWPHFFEEAPTYLLNFVDCDSIA